MTFSRRLPARYYSLVCRRPPPRWQPTTARIQLGYEDEFSHGRGPLEQLVRAVRFGKRQALRDYWVDPALA
jgi:hypothetical protein